MKYQLAFTGKFKKSLKMAKKRGLNIQHSMSVNYYRATYWKKNIEIMF